MIKEKKTNHWVRIMWVIISLFVVTIIVGLYIIGLIILKNTGKEGIPLDITLRVVGIEEQEMLDSSYMDLIRKVVTGESINTDIFGSVLPQESAKEIVDSPDNYRILLVSYLVQNKTDVEVTGLHIDPVFTEAAKERVLSYDSSIDGMPVFVPPQSTIERTQYFLVNVENIDKSLFEFETVELKYFTGGMGNGVFKRYKMVFDVTIP